MVLLLQNCDAGCVKVIYSENFISGSSESYIDSLEIYWVEGTCTSSERWSSLL